MRIAYFRSMTVSRNYNTQNNVTTICDVMHVDADE